MRGRPRRRERGKAIFWKPWSSFSREVFYRKNSDSGESQRLIRPRERRSGVAKAPMARVEKKQPEYGSDVVVELMKAFDIEYAALNPGATFRGIHDSIVNYGGNYKPEVIFCCHEEISVAIAHGYAKAK